MRMLDRMIQDFVDDDLRARANPQQQRDGQEEGEEMTGHKRGNESGSEFFTRSRWEHSPLNGSAKFDYRINRPLALSWDHPPATAPIQCRFFQ